MISLKPLGQMLVPNQRQEIDELIIDNQPIKQLFG
jgi:hypothetical protein